MKAAILIAQNEPLVVSEVDIPELDVGQVLVKIEYSGICGKQLDEINGTRGIDPYLPHLLGHEGAGTVMDVGPGVRKVNRGDRVVLHWMKGSGIESATPRFTRDGAPLNAGWVTTFSEYTVASENRVTPIPGSVGFDIASLMGCAVTTGLGIVFNDANLKPGQSIAVFGVGGIGLNVVQAAALVNAQPIVAIDLYDEKLDRAKDFGATHCVNPSREELAACLSEISNGTGFDATVDTTGNGMVFQMAVESASATGRTVLAGVLGHEDLVTIDAFRLNMGLSLVGSHGGNTKPDTDIPRYLNLYESGKLKLKEQITHRFQLDEINDAVALIQKGEVGRCVISMS